MTGWWVTSLCPTTSTTQSSQTARFLEGAHPRDFCGDLRRFIFRILVSASLQAAER
jgi:hypothetical protein